MKSRMARAIIALFFVAVIAVAAISITQQWFENTRLDLTEQHIYTLSDGTREILSGLKQPITMTLFYTRTAARNQANDQIRYFNNYYTYVRALLEEYETQSNGKVKLRIVDPRPYSQEELAAIRYGLKRFPLSDDENFIFGLVAQTQFGATKTIDFFTPDRQQLVEYDISYLIDTAVTRDKKRLGILSSLDVIGDTGYMAQMKRMQGQQPKQKWGLVRQLEEQYDVTTVPTDTDEIKDIDFLLVIHPKDLPEKTVFAIDQFVLKGGRAIIALDPHSVADTPDMNQRMSGQPYSSASNLPTLLDSWGLTMPANTFAADRQLWQRMIYVMKLQNAYGCFNKQEPMTAQLSEVTMVFPGVLRVRDDAPEGLTYTPLLMTTDQGNTWTATDQELMSSQDFSEYMRNFRQGTEPVTMAYMLNGTFHTAFPDGIQVPVESDEADADEANAEPKTETRTGLTESQQPGAVMVLADVDMLSDLVAYNAQVYRAYGILMPVGNNSSLILNAIEDLSGSSNLISIRSRGNFSRPFVKVDEIEAKADAETADEEARIMAKIKGFEQQLNEKIASIEGENKGAVINQTIVEEKQKIELELREAEKQLRDIKMQKREKVENVKSFFWMFCTLPGPALILLIAVLLGVYRSLKRRRYISHASDA